MVFRHNSNKPAQLLRCQQRLKGRLHCNCSQYCTNPVLLQLDLFTDCQPEAPELKGSEMIPWGSGGSHLEELVMHLPQHKIYECKWVNLKTKGLGRNIQHTTCKNRAEHCINSDQGSVTFLCLERVRSLSHQRIIFSQLNKYCNIVSENENMKSSRILPSKQINCFCSFHMSFQSEVRVLAAGLAGALTLSDPFRIPWLDSQPS